MTVELLRDLDRDSQWILIVDGAEQSAVDTADPSWLEFEYVQMAAAALAESLDEHHPVCALHLGAGLCTLPRWLAARHPSTAQTVVELSTEIQQLAQSIGTLPPIDWRLQDAVTALAGLPTGRYDAVVADLYAGPDTVTGLYDEPGLAALRQRLAPGGVLVINLSDRAPFALARSVAAGLRATFGDLAVQLEPSVARGRRSGNVVLAARDLRWAEQSLRAAVARMTTPVRLLLDEDRDEWIGDASVAASAAQLPVSGEQPGLRLL